MSFSPQSLDDAPAGVAERPGNLDAVSSTPLHPQARAAWLAAVDAGWADPRRLHREARNARLVLDNAREVSAEALGVRADEVSFTSSGTDAVHRGLLGLVRGRQRVGTRVVRSAVEHSSVLHALDWQDTPVTEVGVQVTGQVDLDALVAAVREGDPVACVALQSANHEVGTRQPVAAAVQALSEFEVPLFMDACASIGQEPLPQGWAVAAGSAHKFGGPAGIGLLLVAHRARWRNPFPLDDRADPRTSGFENVPAALATAAALQAAVTEQAAQDAARRELIDQLRRAAAEVGDTEVVGDPVDRLPHVLTFSCLYVDGEALVSELDRLGFGVASGSACTASTLAPSHVLAAMGVLTHGNVRLSLGINPDPRQVSAFVEALPGVVRELRARVGL